MRKYVCKGGQGCVKPGCEFIANGKPWSEDEVLMICPYNHWRSCKWVQVRKAQREKAGEEARQ